MDNLFALFSRYFWLICLGISYFNYVFARNRIGQSGLPFTPHAVEAHRLLRLFAMMGAVPWLVMGLGVLTGYTPSVWYYFRPQDLNPFVIAWVGLMFVMAVWFAGWVLVFGGAAKVRDYNLMSAIGMRSKNPLPLWLIRLYAAASPFFVIVWIYLVSSMNAPIPK
jgi:hypothetical protein